MSVSLLPEVLTYCNQYTYSVASIWKSEARTAETGWGLVGEAPPLLILVLFEPPRTHVETTMFSLKTDNLGPYLLSLSRYGT